VAKGVAYKGSLKLCNAFAESLVRVRVRAPVNLFWNLKDRPLSRRACNHTPPSVVEF
jgi:hypothetical protein